MGRIDPNSANANALAVRLNSPTRFHLQGGDKPAHGYEGDILAEICDTVLEAREAGRLTPQQLTIAKRAEQEPVGVVADPVVVSGKPVDRAWLALVLEYLGDELRIEGVVLEVGADV